MQHDHERHDPPVYELGWWPEIVGAVAVAALTWFLITYSTGIL